MDSARFWKHLSCNVHSGNKSEYILGTQKEA